MRTIDLFAGCGGLSKGFQNAGFDIVAAFEYWDVAANCYEKNFSHPVFRIDLSDTNKAISIIKELSPQTIIGGPPCQDFSHAGKRIEAMRAGLTESFAKIIESIKPKYFVMENVDRAESSAAFARANTIFKKTGYGLTKIVLDACHCGVPQKRKRFFCIGMLGQPDDLVRPYLLSEQSENETTLYDYFGDALDFQFYYRHPRNYNRRAIFSIHEPAPTMRGMNRPVPKGYPGHPNDACPLNDSVRALSTLERALIQTFPPDFIWCGNKTDTEQMIGNAVPVKLAEYVARALLCTISTCSELENNRDDFKSWLIREHNYSERTANDIVSRVRRADKMFHLESQPNFLYLYQLQQTNEYANLSTSVRSQIKRATSLYFDFLQR
ncbi:DNA cytosine methyltransferase [Sporofaciens musculi]|uniref:DNA cytosine methyltransferase n=1 Tax=Sporofaciens musculi TaxID=2681861 RepID=UPI0025A2E9B3|nr:DNA cytosine methyltransferase [Sporofaciens musculi]